MNILNSGRFGMAAGAAGGLRRLLGNMISSSDNAQLIDGLLINRRRD